MDKEKQKQFAEALGVPLEPVLTQEEQFAKTLGVELEPELSNDEQFKAALRLKPAEGEDNQ